MPCHTGKGDILLPYLLYAGEGNILLLYLLYAGEGDILLLYLKRYPRSWSFTTYGYFKGSENFTRGAAVLLFLPLLKKSSLRDTTLVLAGLASKTAALVLLGLATRTWTIFLGRLGGVVSSVLFRQSKIYLYRKG